MALPKTIPSLAALSNCSIPELEISCTFCGKDLKALEKILFHRYELCLKWTNGRALASCRRCLRISGRLEFTNYFQRNILAAEVRASTGASLRFQQIRCRGCLKPLSRQEKQRLERRREFFYVVRGYYRSLCTFCKLYYNAV
ncbi:E6 [Miniopterus schreibersii papillomavirus 1]|uniref:Protein E6 n=1 Tax=Miniopterus schreibersii papillomavirus 1 TaxID=1195364 RepID=J9R367_9PAPI|nr:E6 [Miniopterus schreibersii papillomavirus 1]AFR33943.1 E6 [Miniopterus schreibersii papillomavirus 1]